jgi:hypothetical protein
MLLYSVFKAEYYHCCCCCCLCRNCVLDAPRCLRVLALLWSWCCYEIG